MRQLFCRQYFGEMEQHRMRPTFFKRCPNICKVICRKMYFHTKREMFCISSINTLKYPEIFMFFILLHHGRHVTTSLLKYQSKKVTPQDWEGGCWKSDDVWKFQLSRSLFEKWTFINVLFWKPRVDFWKSNAFITQSIML